MSSDAPCFLILQSNQFSWLDNIRIDNSWKILYQLCLIFISLLLSLFPYLPSSCPLSPLSPSNISILFPLFYKASLHHNQIPRLINSRDETQLWVQRHHIKIGINHQIDNSLLLDLGLFYCQNYDHYKKNYSGSFWHMPYVFNSILKRWNANGSKPNSYLFFQFCHIL